MTTVQHVFQMRPVSSYVPKGVSPMDGVADPALLYGLELEIERLEECQSYQGDAANMYVLGMSGTRDDSLRGSSWEFLTKPATLSCVHHILRAFYSKNKFNEINFTERCSVHVHVNVQDFTAENLRVLAVLYQLFEPVFYAFAGQERENNIFCVPWSQTCITQNLFSKLSTTSLASLRQWQKYTGLNLLPISKLGTVEFRHMPGQVDYRRIVEWCNLIGCLTKCAREWPFEHTIKEIKALTTHSGYAAFAHSVFGGRSNFVPEHDLAMMMEDGVIAVKYASLEAINTPTEVPRWQAAYVRETQIRLNQVARDLQQAGLARAPQF